MGVKISRVLFMKHLIQEKYVPVKQTPSYKPYKRLGERELDADVTWTQLQKHGRKPYLTTRCLQEQLINNIKLSTDGDLALSSGKIRSLVLSKIKEEWKANHTFTAGRVLLPLFVVAVYGLASEEMPSKEMTTIPFPGLTIGSDQDVYSSGTRVLDTLLLFVESIKMMMYLMILINKSTIQRSP